MKNRTPSQAYAHWVPAQFHLPAALATALAEAAAKTVRTTMQTIPRTGRPAGRGATLKPGRATPLWNELASAVEAQLGRRGEQARLARLLGLPRQRLQDLLRTRRHLPDAEPPLVDE